MIGITALTVAFLVLLVLIYAIWVYAITPCEFHYQASFESLPSMTSPEAAMEQVGTELTGLPGTPSSIRTYKPPVVLLAYRSGRVGNILFDYCNARLVAALNRRTFLSLMMMPSWLSFLPRHIAGDAVANVNIKPCPQSQEVRNLPVRQERYTVRLLNIYLKPIREWFAPLFQTVDPAIPIFGPDDWVIHLRLGDVFNRPVEQRNTEKEHVCLPMSFYDQVLSTNRIADSTTFYLVSESNKGEIVEIANWFKTRFQKPVIIQSKELSTDFRTLCQAPQVIGSLSTLSLFASLLFQHPASGHFIQPSYAYIDDEPRWFTNAPWVEVKRITELPVPPRASNREMLYQGTITLAPSVVNTAPSADPVAAT